MTQLDTRVDKHTEGTVTAVNVGLNSIASDPVVQEPDEDVSRCDDYRDRDTSTASVDEVDFAVDGACASVNSGESALIGDREVEMIVSEWEEKDVLKRLSELGEDECEKVIESVKANGPVLIQVKLCMTTEDTPIL